MSKILVIEDDTEVRENLEEILQLEGYETIGAENGIEGLELAQTHLPDLIICDVMMPELDGYQVLAALKDNLDTATIPLIFLTAKVERQDIRQGMNLGADDYITKPFIPEELRTTLKSRFKKQEAVKQKYQKIIKELENKIDYLSYYNPLTQLPNRQGLYQQFNELKPRLEGNLSVLVFSLNELRSIYSNLIQIILSNIGKKLQEYQKAEKDIVILSHVNLDQFIILYQGANIDKIGQNILDMFAEKWLINAQELWLTVSIGIAIHNQPLGGDGEREVDLDNLIAQGEVAMFHVKNNNGNGCLLYNQNIKADLNEQLFLESKIIKGLQQEEFLLYYQPQVDIKTGKIIGAEALLRWNHPELGIVAPGKFIKIAEETGLIIPLGEWVFKKACQQGKHWRDLAGLQTISINLSVRQLYQPLLVEKMGQIIKETTIKPEMIELELTESMLLEYTESVQEKLANLKNLGLKISIDDFGIGYSSLSYLQYLPCDTIKIDKIFVHNIMINGNKKAIVNAIILMAKNLKLNIICEGVETISELAWLAQKKCYIMQGYLFSQPLPASDFEALLKSGKTWNFVQNK